MGYWDDKDADQGFDLGDLLPTKASEGAPADNRYLFHIETAEVAVSESDANSGVPYIKARAVVDEPTEYQGYSIFPSFWLNPDEEDIKRAKANARTRGALRVVLGENAYKQAIERASNFPSLIDALVDGLADGKPARKMPDLKWGMSNLSELYPTTMSASSKRR